MSLGVGGRTVFVGGPGLLRVMERQGSCLLTVKR